MHSATVSVWLLGDQLLFDHPALLAAERECSRDQVRVLLIESNTRTHHLPYHRKKLVLLFSAMRHFAEALRARGYHVEYRQAANYATALSAHVRQHRPARLLTMAGSEFSARQFQQKRLPKLLDIPVEILPNTQFLVGQFNPYPSPQPNKRYVMENFYREMRRHFGVLLEADGEPTGGRWNFDDQNRQPLPKQIRLPEVAGHTPDEITRQVMNEVEAADHGVGSVVGFNWAVTHEQATEALREFLSDRLVEFGPYEDAMTSRSATVFHSLLSAYVNIGLLTPLEMIRAAESAYRQGKAPLNSVEGFIRQILGWREYIYWQYWQQMPDLRTANSWQATRPMPQLFWDAKTDLNCLRHVAERVSADGYAHHIERLMLVCNFCLLAGINPAEVADWFLSFYVDAYDWVVLPNVIGMGLNADGGKTATKPYIASANYINKMSDYCGACRYQPKQRTGADACPFNFLYWNFLLTHEKTLRANPRLGPSVLGLKHLDEAERVAVKQQAAEFLRALPYYPPEDSK